MPSFRNSSAKHGWSAAIVRPPIVTRPASNRRIPASASISSVWPLPETPAMPTISPLRTEKLTSLTRCTPIASRTLRSCTSSATPPMCSGALSRLRASLRPIISSPSSSVEVSEVMRCPTIWPARITETRSVIAMISRSLCVTRIIVLPCARSAREHAEQISRFLRRQHAGRLVKDKNLGAAIQRLQDLDTLLRAHRQVADDRLGIDVQIGTRRKCAAVRRAPSARACAAARRPRRRG